MNVLNFELVPRTSWCDNVRTQVKPKVWDAIRKDVYAEYGHKCGICSRKTRLEAHEIWDYDDSIGAQVLRGMIALCPMCHRCKHIGLTEVLATQGKLKIDSIVAHYCRVNKCDKPTFMKDRNAAFELWAERSKRSWEVDISYIAHKYS